jgi:hypothetical protein
MALHRTAAAGNSATSAPMSTSPSSRAQPGRPKPRAGSRSASWQPCCFTRQCTGERAAGRIAVPAGVRTALGRRHHGWPGCQDRSPVALRCVSRQDQRRLSGQQPKRVNISAVLLAKPAGGRFQFRTLTALLGREPGDFRHRHLEGEAELIRFFRCGCVTPGRPAVRRTRQAGAASARMALGRSAAANLQDQRDRRQLRCHGERGHRAEGYVEQHPDHHASQHPCCAVDPGEQPVG